MPRVIRPVQRPDGGVLRSWRAGVPPEEWRYETDRNPGGLLEVRGEVIKNDREASGISQRHLAEFLSDGATEYTQADISALEHGPVHSWVNPKLAWALAEVYGLPVGHVVALPAATRRADFDGAYDGPDSLAQADAAIARAAARAECALGE